MSPLAERRRARRRPIGGRPTAMPTPASAPQTSPAARNDLGEPRRAEPRPRPPRALVPRRDRGERHPRRVSTALATGGARERRLLLRPPSGHPSRRSSMPVGRREHGRRQTGPTRATRAPPIAMEPLAKRRAFVAGGRQRAHLQRDLDEHAERSERPVIEPGQVVAGHVLHGAPAAADEAAVARDELDLEHRVAERARPAAAGGEAPPRRSRRRPWHRPGRRPAIPGRPPARIRSSSPTRIPASTTRSSPRARTRRGGRVRRPQLGVELRRVPLVEVTPPADDQEPSAVGVRATERLDDLRLRLRMDQIHAPSGRSRGGLAPRPGRAPSRSRRNARRPGGPSAGSSGRRGSNAERRHACAERSSAREDERHEVALLESDAVLSRQRAARVDAEADDLVDSRAARARAFPARARSNDNSGCRLPSPAWNTFVTIELVRARAISYTPSRTSTSLERGTTQSCRW